MHDHTSRRTARTSRQEWLRGPGGWMTLTAVTVLLAALIPLITLPRYYFLGDTQMGAYGHWFHLGRSLRNGVWPIIDLQAWHSGNYLAEGQWGLFSPLTIVIGLASTVVQNVVVFTTVLKLGLLILAALGVFVLMRTYRVPVWGAYVAGVTITLAGATQYLDSPDWVTSQMIWALLPWAWYGLRRILADDANPALALVFGFLIVTVGYVYGTIYLTLVIVACLVDAWLSGNRRGALKVFGVGVCCALVAVTVYLPGILTAPVTTRAGSLIISDGRLQADVPGLLGSMIPTVLSPASPPPEYIRYPAHYIAWFLPLLWWLDPTRARRLLRPAVGLILVLLAGVLWALGPNQIGPLRWPIRVMPLVSLTGIMLAVMLLSKATVRRPSRRRLLVAIGWTLFAAYPILTRFASDGLMTIASTSAVVLGIIGTWYILRPDRGPAFIRRLTGGSARRVGPRKRTGPSMAVRAAIFVASFSVALSVMQHAFYPHPTSVDRHMPTLLSGYTTQASTAQGDVMVVGDVEDEVLASAAPVRDFLVASSWYPNPHRVQNTYSVIGFVAFNQRYCLRFDGATCPALLDMLFTREPSTGQLRVDLLAISTLQILREDFPASRLLNPPPGWVVTEQNDWAVTWVRQTPVPTAGGIVHTSDGLKITPVSVSTREVVFQVDSAPVTGGTVVLSRLDWPGYAVTGGTLALPTDGYLVTVNVPATASGQTVTVRFSPPGWTLELTTFGLGVGAGLIWIVIAAVRRRREKTRLAESVES